ncbi:hypothetical protein N7478_001100 [Penicillium angulare]|uniref:uncharacterized protein n=1 Tax=Penicillium angulare TaxID=116970 RepID=UPI00253F72B8|nr:uncharacterized protein N7478_001100 [Penicillium angulare]KAJ5291849.1 hypothetical protein N7478_001100 [Penicillium angulare]
MKDTRRLPDSWTAVAVHDGPSDQITHHHYVTHAKWSRAYESSHDAHDAGAGVAKRGWPVFRKPSLPLASIPTEERPLMRSEITTGSESEITGSESNQPQIDVPVLEPCLPFTDKYGRCLDILHYGTNSTVRLHQNKTSISPKPSSISDSKSKSKSSHLVAVKVYRYNIFNSSHHNTPHADAFTPSSFSCSESSISSLHPTHPNILSIIDLLHNERQELCLVMPFCAGGDLHELISRSGSTLPKTEADCITAQILRALSFLHAHDTAHRDIRLETILLTEHGAVKLAGFGDGHIRRLWSTCATATATDESFRPRSHSYPSTSTYTSTPSHSSSSAPWSFSLPWLFGSSSRTPPTNANISRPIDVANTCSTASFPGMSLPYIPPEGFKCRSHTAHTASKLREHSDEEDNDPRPADIWGTAIIYLALITGRLAWRTVRPMGEDPRYLEYLNGRRSEDGYPPIEALGRRRRNAIYGMLHPVARKRITAVQMLESEWISRVEVCEAGEVGY